MESYAFLCKPSRSADAMRWSGLLVPSAFLFVLAASRFGKSGPFQGLYAPAENFLERIPDKAQAARLLGLCRSLPP